MKLKITSKIISFNYVNIYVVRYLLCLVFLLKATCFIVVAQNNKINKKISIELKQVNLKTILSILEQQIPYYFVYSEELLMPNEGYSFSFKDITINEVCNQLFHPLNIDYKITESHIVLRKFETKTKSRILLSGSITNENNSSISGVSIYNHSQKQGVVSDFDGHYKLRAFVGDTIFFSSIEYMPLVLVAGLDLFNKIKLEKSLYTIKEVVVIGYGSRDKLDLTGSVSSLNIKPTDIYDNNLSQVLKGHVPGLFSGGNSNINGSSGFINVRGVSSLNPAVNNPLIVIDDLPMFGMGSTLNTYNYIAPSSYIDFVHNTKVDYMFSKSGFERNPLSDINVEDIKSIEILKDAYSTSIFGSRGATGVILIETRRGTKLPSLSISSSFSLSEPVALPSLLNAKDYSSIYSKYYNLINSENENVFPVTTNTNWVDKVTRIAATNDICLTYSGSSEDFSYFASCSFLNKESYIENSDYKRYTTRFNLSYKLKENITLGSNYGFNHSINTSVLDEYVYRQAVLRAPNLPIMNLSGDYVYDKGENTYGNIISNPVASVKEDVNRLYDYRWYGNLYADIKILSSLSYKFEFGVDWYNGEFYQRIHSNPAFESGIGLMTNVNNDKYVINNTLHYSKILNTHNINFVLGQSFEKASEYLSSIRGRNFSSDNVVSISSAKEVRLVAEERRKWAMLSYFSRLDYTYDNRYQLGLTYRIDGSSRFSLNNRYVGFPSMSIACRLSEFDIIKDLDFFSNLKVRSSVGYSGVDGSGSYFGNQGIYAPNKQGLSYNGVDIIEIIEPSNVALEWERTKTLNLGVDISNNANTVAISIDYYKKYISNLLYVSSLASYKGFTSQLQNIGSMENHGLEISISMNKAFGDWTFSPYLNVSYNENILTKLNYKGSDYWSLKDGLKYFVEGKPAGVFLLYDWAGVNPKNGNSLWRYSDGSISETPPASVAKTETDNKYIAGKPLPDCWGGFGFNISYKKCSLGMHFDFAYGNKMFNATKAILTTYTSGDANNLSSDMLSYWNSSGMITDIPALINKSNEKLNYNSAYSSDRFLEDASYIRLSDLKLSYNFGINNLFKKMNIKRLLLYVQCCNIYTFSHYSGLDPTVSYFGSSSLLAGYDELSLPSVRTCKIGFKIGF